MRNNTITSSILLILVYIFNYLSTSWTIGESMTNLAQIFPFPYMPPGWTFGLAWGSIYLALLAYLVYIWTREWSASPLVKEISPRFWISCVLNILRIVSTSMEWYVISVALIVWLFLVLWTILNIIHESAVTKKEEIFVKIPFWLYYGWISLATTIVATSQLVYQRNVELPLGDTRTIVVVWTGLLVALYSWLRRKNLGQLVISLVAFAGIASVLF